jgi:hypothetical protein
MMFPLAFANCFCLGWDLLVLDAETKEFDRIEDYETIKYQMRIMVHLEMVRIIKPSKNIKEHNVFP